MIVILASLWVAADRDCDFAEYEEIALGIFREHGGEVLSRFRPAEGPTEIHVLRCPSKKVLDAFREDERLAEYRAIRSEVIVKTEIVMGEELPSHG